MSERRTSSGPSILAACGLSILSGALLASALRALHPALCCDAQGYYDLSQALILHGPMALARNIRTYGYPALLAAISAWRPQSQPWVHSAAAGVQGALTGLAAALSFRLARRLRSTPAASAAMGAAVLLNPMLLARASEVLTDAVAALLLFAALLPAIDEDSETLPRLAARAAASTLAASAATAVRPANVIFLAAFGLWWLLRAARASRIHRWRVVGAVLLAAAIPLLPQILLNNRHVGTVNPFVMSSEYARQTVWGMRTLKNETYVSPGSSPYLVAGNPYFDPAWVSTRDFVRHAPAGYAATLCLHAFALLDQDALFTYVTDRKPWYRWPVSLVGYAWLFVALLGAVCALARRGPCRGDDALRRAGLLSAALCALCIAFYAPTLIESRFATPIYLLGVPILLIGVRRLGALAAERAWGSLVTLAAAGLLFLGACAWTSRWIESHAALWPEPPQSTNPPPGPRS